MKTRLSAFLVTLLASASAAAQAPAPAAPAAPAPFKAGAPLGEVEARRSWRSEQFERFLIGGLKATKLVGDA